MSRDLTVEDRKQCGLLVLDEVARVAELLGLRYFLAYGTLLGAIRHNGYIPWDDDVDIWMSEHDFKIMLDKFNEVCNKDFKLLSWKDDCDYPFFMPKVVYLKTSVRERWMAKPVSNLGVWVDIFSLNSIDADEWHKLIAGLAYKHELDRRTALFHHMCFFSKLDILRMVARNRGLSELSCIKNRPAEFTEKLYKCMNGNPEADTLIPVDAIIKGGYVFPKGWFDEPLMHTFEDRKYPIPAEWGKILEAIYGDYMTLPPEKERRLRQHLAYARWKD